MKIAGKRIPRGNLLLFLSYAFISVSLLLVISSMRMERINDAGMSGMYSDNHRSFYVSHSENEEEWERVMPDLDSRYNHFAIYLPIEDDKAIVRGVYVKGKVMVPPMIKGKYFDDSTSWTDTPRMVVGKNYEKDIVTRGDKMFYFYDEKEFEVLGIMGTEDDSRINNMNFMDFKSAVNMAGINSEYVLDTKKDSDYYDIGKDMTMLFSLPAEVIIDLEYVKVSSLVASFLTGDKIMKTVYGMVLISFSLSTVLVTLIWFRFRQPLLFACSLCGYEQKWKHMEVAGRYGLVELAGFIMGLAGTGVISLLVPDVSLLPLDVLKAFGIIMGLGAGIWVWCFVIMKGNVNKN